LYVAVDFFIVQPVFCIGFVWVFILFVGIFACVDGTIHAVAKYHCVSF